MSSINVHALIAMIIFFQLWSINSAAGCSQCSWKTRLQWTCKSRLDSPLRLLNLCYFLQSGFSAIVSLLYLRYIQQIISYRVLTGCTHEPLTRGV